MKYSITAYLNNDNNIKRDYGGRKIKSMPEEFKRRVEDIQRDLFDEFPGESKRLTIKIS